MVKTASLFSQLLEQVPRNEFGKLVERHDAEYGAKVFTCWSQFTSLLFCRLVHAEFLREILLIPAIRPPQSVGKRHRNPAEDARPFRAKAPEIPEDVAAGRSGATRVVQVFPSLYW